MAENEIYQYSIVSALMDGVGSSGLPLSDLITHGDHGLGTFRHMAGEMIVVDGHVYQMKSDGSIATVDTSPGALDKTDGLPIVAPFAMLTRFRPTVHRAPCSPHSKDELAALLSELLLPTVHIQRCSSSPA
ncbi:alpha-acetolactate decarboxylase [Magnaporthiopsis poae ATCC 64411]|uniref:Alpha-acetolactate decarboxylase n=1 Tax=Magnaporthiopsis poae (strain ATCC 64411 / 73-15) TaxID=644358 RepID=A0A0C4EE10_MAGP6|nr:alpha-acetolactate decarboxylase [Magnaporthiopsis poae ATCC 64411]